VKLSREQLEGRKRKAVEFVRRVLEDDDRADEIEDESLESYAERRKIQITNPKKRGIVMASKQQLQDRIDELEEQNEDLEDRLDQVLDIVAPEEEEAEEEEPEPGEAE
jgi:hypothetical protein